MEQHLYHSKRGWFIYIPLILFLGFEALFLITGEFIPAIVLFLVIAFGFLPAFFNTYYLIKDDKLKIRSGYFFNTEIQISEIRRIETTRTLLSSPALSLDRLEVHYNKYDTVVISPEDKQEFVKQLQRLNPSITFSDKHSK